MITVFYLEGYGFKFGGRLLWEIFSGVLSFSRLLFQGYVTIVHYILVSNLTSIHHPTNRGYVSINCNNNGDVK
jgi:hypothetical protein